MGDEPAGDPAPTRKQVIERLTRAATAVLLHELRRDDEEVAQRREGRYWDALRVDTAKWVIDRWGVEEQGVW